MNIGYAINEALYEHVWKCVQSECRQTAADQTTPYISTSVYDSIGFKIDNILCGDIALEVRRIITKEKYEYPRTS
jgi:hypothetical protein